MATMDYVEIPSYATRLRSAKPTDDLRPAPKIVTSLPRPEHSPVRSTTGMPAAPMSPSKGGSNLTSMLLSSALQLPVNAPAAPRDYGSGKGARLLSTRDPLSIPITTTNFRRFVSKSTPIFWLQDRVEEIVLWKKSWKYTLVWMAAYAFLCYFPRLILLIPHAVIIGVLLATHPSMRNPGASESPSPKPQQPPPPSQPNEGSVDWLANLQAIQNLMGAVSDGHDLIVQVVPYLSYSSPYTGLILTFALVTFFGMIPLVNLLPMRATFLVLGLAPFAWTHPFTQHTLLPALQAAFGAHANHWRACVLRIIDDDNLEDKHWGSELREVELFENERWVPGTSGGNVGEEPTKAKPEGTWSKAALKSGERKAWTRGRDGWSGVNEDGSHEVSSNLTFSLAHGWSFVETEDWRPDLEGTWAEPLGADEAGWVYTNDIWHDSRPLPLEEWRSSGGMTRRRRWTRRIYYSPNVPV
ncbi:integral peroxisomal membrane peroxin-domain-containing protein [Epithele typhae]|uniref:integral peroxisomal membrane peroxin-domain-containing protein n=1 Tax=Epithele typhae TaxID=378194 RepID=UPI0020088071|nr:integral peroxisomal membrane peroxin-domain-containing protein [Epithele typhae]KAH9933173.1 integral peroxisomal membrane peroxin-domain-containing protein [Epithele typhae]